MPQRQTPYSIEEHRHRFAVWAAARAAQRRSLSVGAFQRALDNCGIREFLRQPGALETDATTFRTLHERWCRHIVATLDHPSVTFGRAAKLIAVYLKATIIITHPTSRLALVAYPPIDRILLANIAQARRERHWTRYAWSLLSEHEYYQLIDQLQRLLPPATAFWTIEQHWTANNEE